MRRTIILSAALAIILLGLWGTAVIYFDQARLRGIVSDRLSAQIGRRVQIVGSLRISLFPRPTISVRELVIDGPEALDGRKSLSADHLSMTLRVLPLLRGRLSPAQMTLSDAVLRLDASDDDDDDAPGEDAGESVVELLAGRSLRLADVTLVIPTDGAGPARTIAIDLIELDRFSLDETVAFRFRGNLGEPPVLENVRVDGSLHVPASRQMPVRLRDMQLRGHLVALDESISLSGDLSASRQAPLRIGLAAGRFDLGERSFNVSFDYRDGPTPALDVLASGPGLDLAVFEPVSIGPMLDRLVASLWGWSQRVDLRSQIQLDHLRAGAVQLADTRLDLRSQQDGLGVNLTTLFPGGVLEGSGRLSGGRSESLAVDVSIAEVDQLLTSLDAPDVLAGSGEARLTLTWIPAVSDYVVEGEIGLWDGFWRVSQGDEETRRVRFDRFDGQLRLTPGQLALPYFQLRGGGLAGTGWAAIELPGGAVGGELYRSKHETAPLAISGVLTPPAIELQPRPEGPVAEDAAGREEADSPQGEASP